MPFIKNRSSFLAMVGAAVMLLSTIAIAQSATAKPVKQLKPQATCPVMGDPIDKNLFVDYKGKRIYVCMQSCLPEVRKDPEKYIKKLERMGEGVEVIGKEVNAAPSKMPGDSMMKEASAGYWTCPMHPEIHQSEAGKCPICGMKLVFKKSDKGIAQTKGKTHDKMNGMKM